MTEYNLTTNYSAAKTTETDYAGINQTLVAGTITTPDWINITDVFVSTTAQSNVTEDFTTASPYISCVEWLETQHVLFQFACLALGIGFVVPYSYKNHVLISRGSLVLGALLLLLWGAVVICHRDVLVCYVLICIVNLIHCIVWIVRHWPTSLPRDLEDMYCKLFKPLHVNRTEFKEFSAIANMKHLTEGTAFAMEGSTRMGDILSVLLTGRLKVTCDNLFLHTIEPLQFIDSVEYDRVATDSKPHTFQVSIRAMEESSVCVFDKDKLEEFLRQKPHISAVLDKLVGKDITHKLYQVQEMLMSHAGYPQALGGSKTSSVLSNHSGVHSPYGSTNLSPAMSYSPCHLNGAHHLNKSRSTVSLGIVTRQPLMDRHHTRPASVSESQV